MARNPRKVTRMTITPEILDEITRTGVDWQRVRGMTAQEIEHNLAADPDAASPMTDAEITAARVRWVRQRTGLSQSQFATAFRIPLRTVQEWEQARREPDAAALAYLTVIERDPQGVQRALETA